MGDSIEVSDYDLWETSRSYDDEECYFTAKSQNEDDATFEMTLGKPNYIYDDYQLYMSLVLNGKKYGIFVDPGRPNECSKYYKHPQGSFQIGSRVFDSKESSGIGCGFDEKTKQYGIANTELYLNIFDVRGTDVFKSVLRLLLNNKAAYFQFRTGPQRGKVLRLNLEGFRSIFAKAGCPQPSG